MKKSPTFIDSELRYPTRKINIDHPPFLQFVLRCRPKGIGSSAINQCKTLVRRTSNGAQQPRAVDLILRLPLVRLNPYRLKRNVLQQLSSLCYKGLLTSRPGSWPSPTSGRPCSFGSRTCLLRDPFCLCYRLSFRLTRLTTLAPRRSRLRRSFRGRSRLSLHWTSH